MRLIARLNVKIYIFLLHTPGTHILLVHPVNLSTFGFL